MNFEWDEEKAESNLKNHHISFEEATLVFEDFFAVEQFDADHSNADEQRFIRLGIAKEKLLFVVYTMRGENPAFYRIISARLAKSDEEKIYWEERDEQ